MPAPIAVTVLELTVTTHARRSEKMPLGIVSVQLFPDRFPIAESQVPDCFVIEDAALHVTAALSILSAEVVLLETLPTKAGKGKDWSMEKIDHSIAGTLAKLTIVASFADDLNRKRKVVDAVDDAL